MIYLYCELTKHLWITQESHLYCQLHRSVTVKKMLNSSAKIRLIQSVKEKSAWSMSMFTSDDEIVSGHLSDRSEEKSDISFEDDSWSDHSDCSFSMSEHVHSTSLSCSDQSCLSTSNNTTTSISDISTGDRDEEKTMLVLHVLQVFHKSWQLVLWC